VDAPAGGVAAFFHAVERGVRNCAGRSLPPSLKRWRNTRSRDEVATGLDPATLRFLVRYGLLDAGDSQDARRQSFEELLRQGARASGEAPGVLAAWLRAFAEGEYGWPERPLCGPQPRCTACPLKESCRYLLAGAKATRLSGQAVAKALAGTEPGAQASTDAAALLAFLLFGPTQGAAAVARTQALLGAQGGLRGLLGAADGPAGDLGLPGPVRARLRAIAELVELWSHEESARGKTFSAPQELFEHYRLRLREVRKERFLVLCLDQKNRLIGEEQVSEGSLTEALVHPREALGPAVRLSAAAIAVVHNHPSGDPAPSRADKALTKRLVEAAELLGIRLLDHVIVGDSSYFSFNEAGLL
jgi:DNA repair protein RadC